MRDWTDGYVTSLDYTYGYYPELNPSRIALAFLRTGLAPPPILTACELGFGQGMSANVHAAASTTQWYGTDFNPAQTVFAQELAVVSGAGAKFFDQSFTDFCNRSDLPDFDFICLHGIWSWISEANRSVIVDFLRRKLKVGGVVYVSYTAQPSQAAMVPMREVLAEHAELMGAPAQGLVSRIDPALDFAEKLLAVSPLHALANPLIGERLKLIRAQDRSYVAHDYFNRDWMPISFARTAEWLAPAKLEYACSANYFDLVDAWNLNAEQQAFLKEIPDARFRETVRDIMVNQSFRKDYWVKGARRLTVPEKNEALRRQRVMMVALRPGVSLKVRGALGEGSLNASICEPVLDALADHRPKTLGQIELDVKGKDVNFSQLMEAVLPLIETGGLAAVQDDTVIRAAKKQTDRLNAFLCDKARNRPNDTRMLASPVIGMPILGVWRVVQFFLLAMSHGKKQPADMAAYVLPIVLATDATTVGQDKPLESPDRTLAGLTSQAIVFTEKVHPTFKALQIV